MPPFARCSDLPRLINCAGDAVLNGTRIRSERANVAIEWGWIAHRWMETGSIEPNIPTGYPKLHDQFAAKVALTETKRSEWWPSDVAYEVAVSIDPEKSSAELYDGDDRDDWKQSRSDSEITGTVDAHWYILDQLHIDDLKTGRFASVQSHYYQLLGYGLGIVRALGYRDSIKLSITHWPRYPLRGIPRRETTEVQYDELVDFEKRLLKLRDDIRRAKDTRTIQLTTGEHCLWCDSRDVCPKQEGKKP